MMIENMPPAPLERLRRAKNILILTHNNPDGDALGSSVALTLALKQSGRRADLHLVGEYAENLGFLLNQNRLVPVDLEGLDSYDLLVILDCHDFDRMGADEPELKKRLAALPTPIDIVVIDHHTLKPAEKDGPLWLRDPSASSTGELVFKVLKVLELPVPKGAVEALMTAISTDTGFFSQSNTTPSVLRTAADLLELGGSIDRIYSHLNNNLPLRRMRLLNLALDSLNVHLDGRLATIFLTRDMLVEAGAEMGDSDGFVNIGRSLKGVTVSAFIKESAEGTVKVSLRSSGTGRAAGLATKFCGGGHEEAAAYNDLKAATVQEALQHLLDVAPDFL